MIVSSGQSLLLASVVLCINMSTNALRLLPPSWTMLTKAMVSARSLSLRFSHNLTIDPFSKDGEFPEKISGCIDLRDVSVTHTSKHSIETLGGVNIVFEEGKMTAITGPSGCDESTIINLLGRDYEVPGSHRYRKSYFAAFPPKMQSFSR